MKEGNKDKRTSPCVIVVGAGISGLACASRLIESGIDDVTVLEARDRIGGRISTVRSSDEDDLFFFEGGAQWIHGCDGNEVKTFVDENSIESIKHIETTEYHFENEKSLHRDSEMLRTLQQSTDTFFQILEDAEDGIDTYSHKNVLSYLEENWSKKTNNTDYITQLYRCLIEHQRAEEGCNSMREVGLSNYNQYQYCPGGDVSVVGGLDQILNKLASNLEQKRILLNKRVMKVNWSNPEGQVILNVRDTTRKKEEIFRADIVVLTTPLGFLKENHKKLFVPSLPVTKSEAIENLGCGSVAKVILRFDQPLCDDVPVTWLFLRKNPSRFGYYKVTVTKCYANCEQFITIWLTGEGAMKAEKTSEEKLLAIFYDDLRQFVPNLPQPKSAQVTKWTEDPYTRGSYTYLSVDSSPDDLIQMAEPLRVNNDGQLIAKVLFAGEATHSRYYSAMHGAYESGIREAERIINIFK